MSSYPMYYYVIDLRYHLSTEIFLPSLDWKLIIKGNNSYYYEQSIIKDMDVIVPTLTLRSYYNYLKMF